MTRIGYKICSVAIIAFVTVSCRESGNRNISQGEIHYTIDYMGDMVLPREYMPRNLVVSFKDDKILFEITAPIGNSGIFNLSNPDRGISDTYISLLTLRYFYAAEPGEIPPGFEKMEGIEIRKSNETSVICGYNCRSAEVTFPSDRNKKYKIWYTNEINVSHPNAATPFKDIDGVLMNFFFIMGPVVMRFEAETVYKKDIPDKLFERREKYTEVTKEEINSFINKMINL